MKHRFFFAALLCCLAWGVFCAPSAFAENGGPFTIYFEANGGTGVSVVAFTSVSGKLTSLPEPKLSGYTFEGWYTDDLEGDRITLNTEFNCDTTIYARWLPVTTQTSASPPATVLGTTSLKSHAGTLLVCGTVFLTLFILYGM